MISSWLLLPMAVVMGALDANGEAVIVDDIDPTVISEDETPYLETIPRLAPSGALVCAAGGLNHYEINHTTGQGALQGFSLKVARILKMRYPNENSSSARRERADTTATFYKPAHPVSKGLPLTRKSLD